MKPVKLPGRATGGEGGISPISMVGLLIARVDRFH